MSIDRDPPAGTRLEPPPPPPPSPALPPPPPPPPNQPPPPPPPPVPNTGEHAHPSTPPMPPSPPTPKAPALPAVPGRQPMWGWQGFGTVPPAPPAPPAPTPPPLPPAPSAPTPPLPCPEPPAPPVAPPVEGWSEPPAPPPPAATRSRLERSFCGGAYVRRATTASAGGDARGATGRWRNREQGKAVAALAHRHWRSAPDHPVPADDGVHRAARRQREIADDGCAMTSLSARWIETARSADRHDVDRGHARRHRERIRARRVGARHRLTRLAAPRRQRRRRRARQQPARPDRRDRHEQTPTTHQSNREVSQHQGRRRHTRGEPDADARATAVDVIGPTLPDIEILSPSHA